MTHARYVGPSRPKPRLVADQVLTSQDVADILQVHARRAAALMRDGEIAAFQLVKSRRGPWRTTRAHVLRYIARKLGEDPEAIVTLPAGLSQRL